VSPSAAQTAADAERSGSTALLSLPTSAYQASLAVDAEAAFLLTSHAAYRLVQGRAPEALNVELGLGATSTRGGLLFWSEGAVREASKQSGRSHPLATLAARPQLFVSSGDAFAWLQRSDEHRFSLGSVASNRSITVYTSRGSLDAVAMLNDWIFFVERPTDGEWRIGGVRTQGGAPVFTNTRRGRSPSMLAVREDVYYYDGSVRELRRISPDLRREEVLVSDFVCSPLAVAERVYCANVEGVFEIVPEGRPRLLVKLGRGGFVTDLAANARYLFWIADAGADQLVVNSLPFPQSR
jgi:hypothetical protein